MRRGGSGYAASVRRAAPLLLLIVVSCVACGGSSASRPAGPTLAAVLGTPGATTVVTPDLVVFGGTDFPTGHAVRLPFQLFQKDGKVVQPDGGRALLYLAPSADATALGPYPVRELSLAGHGVHFDPAGPQTILVADAVPLPAAGAWYAVVTFTVAGEQAAASNQFSILPREATPPLGSSAPATATPTLRDVGGDGQKISTQRPVDASLLQHSVKDLLAKHRPFVVVFATPRFCTSRLCGPIVDIVGNVQRALRGTGLAFVHAEIYANLDPQQGASPWVLAWGLPTEPWVFVVNRQGRITAKFEGAVTEQELTQAGRAALAG